MGKNTYVVSSYTPDVVEIYMNNYMKDTPELAILQHIEENHNEKIPELKDIPRKIRDDYLELISVLHDHDIILTIMELKICKCVYGRT